MRKKLRDPTVGVFLVSLACLVACGESERSEVKAVDLELIDPGGQEVVFWYQHSRQREEALIELIDEYNRTNAHGIKVRGEYMGSYGDIYRKMFVGLQGGTLPQLVVAYQNQARAYFEADGIVDLAPYMDSKKWGLSVIEKADFVQSFLQQDHNKGVQTGFPPNRSMEILFYNADWLQELGYADPPTTWNEFADMCRKAQAQPFSKSTNKERSLGFLLELDASRLATMVFTRGGDFMNDEKTAYTFNTPQVQQALQLMQDLIREGALDIVSERYMDQQEFGVGNVLFALRSTSGLPFFKSVVADGLDFAWSVAAPPHQFDDPVVNVYGASLSVCRTTPEQQLATWLFVKWFTQPQQQARWARASNYFPVRKSTVKELEAYFEENPGYASAFQLLDYGKSEPTVQGYQTVREMIADAMVEITEGGNIDAVLSRLEQQANKTLKSTQTAPTPEKITVQIGETKRGRYFEVTVNGARRERKYNDYKTAADGSLYLIIDVTAKCIDTESRVFSEGSAFTTYKGKELEYDKAEHHSQKIGALNPLIKETGKVIYLVPEELTGPYYWVPGREADLRFALGNF